MGGGAILKQKSAVDGASTAAAIWATGAVGISVGLKEMEIAIAISVMTLVTLFFLRQAKNKVEALPAEPDSDSIDG